MIHDSGTAKGKLSSLQNFEFVELLEMSCLSPYFA